MSKAKRSVAPAALMLALSACGNGSLGSIPAIDFGSLSSVNPFGRPSAPEFTTANPFLFAAAQDVLSFLPVTASDPVNGTLETGFGVPPGGNTAYRAVVRVTSPALDARVLDLALFTRSGPVARDTRNAVEDAILARARQLRIASLNR